MAFHFYLNCIFLMQEFACAGASIRQRMLTEAMCSQASYPLRDTLEHEQKKPVFNHMISLAEFLNFWIILNEFLGNS